MMRVTRVTRVMNQWRGDFAKYILSCRFAGNIISIECLYLMMYSLTQLLVFDHQSCIHAIYIYLFPSRISSQAQGGLEAALADLQHRDLTPEDYELLLRLDESVKAK